MYNLDVSRIHGVSWCKLPYFHPKSPNNKHRTHATVVQHVYLLLSGLLRSNIYLVDTFIIYCFQCIWGRYTMATSHILVIHSQISTSMSPFLCHLICTLLLAFIFVIGYSILQRFYTSLSLSLSSSLPTYFLSSSLSLSVPLSIYLSLSVPLSLHLSLPSPAAEG